MGKQTSEQQTGIQESRKVPKIASRLFLANRKIYNTKNVTAKKFKQKPSQSTVHTGAGFLESWISSMVLDKMLQSLHEKHSTRQEYCNRF